jgi:hypothetical protein
MGSRRTLLKRGRGGRRFLLLALATWGTLGTSPVVSAQAGGDGAKAVMPQALGAGARAPGMGAGAAFPDGRSSLPAVRGRVSDTL